MWWGAVRAYRCLHLLRTRVGVASGADSRLVSDAGRGDVIAWLDGPSSGSGDWTGKRIEQNAGGLESSRGASKYAHARR